MSVHSGFTRRTAFCMAVAATIAVSGCTGESGGPPASKGEGAPGCAPASPITRDASTGFGEVRGTSRTAQLWGLVMAPQQPVRSGQEVKIVWRMTGTGDLTLTVTGPDGRKSDLAWGPEAHSGSSYTRPGDEWGAGYRFTEPGCWRLSARRGPATADVWIKIAP